ncbi:sensor histidine kinase [Geothrix sp. PMB-07]|uniref:sensor histidine kinase n=1 Tax=Geothrix sp. PMB-07 TaxID=3068640 RepID=UPI0027414AAF|nr:HAMP domain-containing sensor histidine kinase [Geothrix sp. PMB-07]WLT31514.1 HAMP domain-containing sensor histidine kinase [Geothrix sp. PMB-07]
MVDRLDERDDWTAIWRSNPVVVAGLLVLLAANAILPLMYEGHLAVQFLDYSGVLALAFWTAGLACWRARRHGPAAFGLLGLGAALGGLRYLPTALRWPQARILGPAISILSLLALGIGFLTWPQQMRMPRDRIRASLDGLALSLSMFTVGWIVLGPLSQVGALSRDMMLIYLLQISVCLGLLALWLLRETRLEFPEQARAKAFVRGALVLLLFHSTLVVALRVTGHYRGTYLGHAAEVLHQGAIFLLAMAVLSPASAKSAVPPKPRPSPLRALIPSLVVLWVLCLIAILVFQPQAVPSKPLLGFGLALMGILLLRHGLLILDLERLSHSLEARVEARTRELEAHHREAMNDLRMRMMAGLAAGLAHDLNNLLGILRLRLGLLRETCTPEQLEDVDVLQQTSERAIAMTHRILSSDHRQEVAPLTFCLPDWLHAHHALLGAQLQPGQRLEITAPPQLQVCVDPGSLEQILQNLVSNARDAMGPDGHIKITAIPHGGRAGIEVRDNGPGLPQELQDRLFEPFFTTKRTGTGLGLATVRNLVHLNRGSIEVSSQPGRGTAFFIELPQEPLLA